MGSALNVPRYYSKRLAEYHLFYHFHAILSVFAIWLERLF